MKSRARTGIQIKFATCALSSNIGLSKQSVMTTGNSGLSTLTPWRDVDYNDACSVLSMCADALINQGLNIPNVVKIDVEGHELDVLQGFGKFLSAPTLRAIIFEDNGSGEVHEILRDAGYSIRNVGGKD